ncbi:DUF4065 domain-containing protein [Crassaminicella thermophila]|uniref:DUF4065 domain-containing protein n=1 Tax=Crassaminicella thermophila TaxID=2599308 RepID=A0A5C0SFM4_CRATE|nr:Panacea domain-containing protein [Crassaminicella thermophila]QEK12692.1 DUF4065 domain-containing protein [Crassaminicella thermophila]
MSKVIYLNEHNRQQKEPIRNVRLRDQVNLVKCILYFAQRTTQRLYKTKLNKLLFYAQFLYYKKYGDILLNYKFIKDYHGPVIENLDDHLDFFAEAKLIKLKSTNYGTVILPGIKLKNSAYEEKEKEILKKVLDKFDMYTAAEISDYSHKEDLWLYTELKEEIDIERAIELHEF